MSQDTRTVALLKQLAGNEGITAQLGPGRVAIVLSAQQADDPQAQLLATFATNLLARLFPVVRILDICVPSSVVLNVRLPRWAQSTLDGTLRRFLRELRPPVKCCVRERIVPREYDAVLGIGAGLNERATIYAGGNQWLTKLSTHAPIEVRGSTNPVGAYATAAFAVAEIWKQVLGMHSELFPTIPIRPLIGEFAFSSLDYRHDDGGPNPELPSDIALNRLTFVGAGAGGAATAFTLASVPHVSGSITAVEPDEVTDTNLNRLVPATEADAATRRSKVDVIEELFLGHPDVVVLPFADSFDNARKKLENADFRRIVATVHSRSARRSIQLETPEVLWDAGATETGEFFIWRVGFGQTPCLVCRLSSGRHDPEQEKANQLAKLLGFTEADWLRKIRDNEPFTCEEVKSLKVHYKKVGSNLELPIAEQRFGDWEATQCGKLELPDEDDEIPIPFAPVLAGVLLAGEVIKQEGFPQFVLDSYYWNTLLGGFMSRNRPHRPAPRFDCPICSKPAFRSQFDRRWRL